MFARSTTFHGRPDNVDAGIAFVKDEVVPMLDDIEGCRGLSLLVDRETGQAIATTSWDSEATMNASEELFRSMRERGRDLLGGSIAVDLWEVTAMHHHGQRGECCRVSWIEGDPEPLTDAFRAVVLPRLEQTDGFCSASLLVSRATGLGCATTVWESRAAMEASRAPATDMRRQAASAAGGDIVDVHEFELAYAHLHVPEMA